MCIPSDLQGVGDPVPFLLISTERVHASLMAAIGIPIKKWSMEQYLRSTGKIFSCWGHRHNKLGKIEFRLGWKLATYAKQDPPSTQEQPIQVFYLQALDSAY